MILLLLIKTLQGNAALRIKYFEVFFKMKTIDEWASIFDFKIILEYIGTSFAIKYSDPIGFPFVNKYY